MLSYFEFLQENKLDSIVDESKLTIKDLKKVLKRNGPFMVKTVDGEEYNVEEIDGDSIFATDEDGADVELSIEDISSF